jgi:hypothetical protein
VRNVLALLGALIIGALGSGSSETVFKPVFLWLGTALLDIATLGKQSLIDSIYVEVAKGPYERASNATYQALMAAYGATGVMIPVAGLAFVMLIRKIDAGRPPVATALLEPYRRFPQRTAALTFYVSPNLIEWFWNQILRYTFKHFLGTNAHLLLDVYADGEARWSVGKPSSNLRGSWPTFISAS